MLSCCISNTCLALALPAGCALPGLAFGQNVTCTDLGGQLGNNNRVLFVTLIVAAGMRGEVLTYVPGAAQRTILAPSDAALQQSLLLLGIPVKSLGSADPKVLRSLVSYHVLPGKIDVTRGDLDGVAVDTALTGVSAGDRYCAGARTAVTLRTSDAPFVEHAGGRCGKAETCAIGFLVRSHRHAIVLDRLLSVPLAVVAVLCSACSAYGVLPSASQQHASQNRLISVLPRPRRSAVLSSNMEGCNALIHFIDAPLLPCCVDVADAIARLPYAGSAALMSPTPGTSQSLQFVCRPQQLRPIPSVVLQANPWLG